MDQDRPLWGSNYVEPDFSATGSESFSYGTSESSDEDSSEIFPPDPARVSSDKYDVIIRYNKRDVSNGFISHLLAALCQKGISASIFKRPDGVPECRVVITFLTHRSVFYNFLEFCEHLPSKELGVSQFFYRVSPSTKISNTKKLERFPLPQKRMWWNVLQPVSQMSDYILTDKYVVSGFLTLRVFDEWSSFLLCSAISHENCRGTFSEKYFTRLQSVKLYLII